MSLLQYRNIKHLVASKKLRFIMARPFSTAHQETVPHFINKKKVPDEHNNYIVLHASCTTMNKLIMIVS